MSLWLEEYYTPPIERRLITALQTYGLPYGSRIWGGSTDHSDYDYAIRIDDLQSLPDIQYTLAKNRYNKFKHLHHFKYTTMNEECYDITVFDEDIFPFFKQAVSIMCGTYLEYPDKAYRIRTFESILAEVYRDT
jgi:hypothetical protein